MSVDNAITFRFPIRGNKNADLSLKQFQATQLYLELSRDFNITIKRERIDVETEEKNNALSVTEMGLRIFADKGALSVSLRQVLNDLSRNRFYFTDHKLIVKSYFSANKRISQRIIYDITFTKNVKPQYLTGRLKDIAMSFLTKVYLYTHIWVNESETGILTTINFAGPTVAAQNLLRFDGRTKKPWTVVKFINFEKDLKQKPALNGSGFHGRRRQG